MKEMVHGKSNTLECRQTKRRYSKWMAKNIKSAFFRSETIIHLVSEHPMNAYKEDYINHLKYTINLLSNIFPTQ